MLRYLDDNGELVYTNCREDDPKQVASSRVVLDILLCATNGAPSGSTKDAFEVELDVKVLIDDEQFEKVAQTALQFFVRHCQNCHGEGDVPISQELFAGREAYELRTKSETQILGELMPPRAQQSPQWSDDRSLFLDAIVCLERQTEDKCSSLLTE